MIVFKNIHLQIIFILTILKVFTTLICVLNCESEGSRSDI